MTDGSNLLDQLDEDTVLRIVFSHSHTAQYLYRFPSGINVVLFGDTSLNRKSYMRTDDEDVIETIEGDGVEKVVLHPFDDSPFAANWEFSAEHDNR